MTSKWATPNFPKGLYDQLEEYAKSQEGQEKGYNSGKDILVVLGRKFMEEHPISNLKKVKK